MSSNFSSTEDVRRACASRIVSPSRSARVSARRRRERVSRGQAGDLRLAADRDGPEPGVVERAAEIPDVGPAVPQRRVLLPPVQVEQLDLDARVGRREGADGPGDVQPGCERDDEPLDAPVDLVDAPDGGVDRREHPARLLVKLLPRGRELHAAGGPDEERAPELLLERADLPAEDGLRDVQLLGSPAEVPVLRDRGEVAQLAQIEIHAPRVSITAERYWTRAPGRPQSGPMIVITTPTGDIGSQVLATLLSERSRQRGRSSASSCATPRSSPARSGTASTSWRDRTGTRTSSTDAFAGADAVFWLVPPDSQAPSLEVAYSGFTRAAAQAFRAHGVGHVVGVSALGRGTPVAGRAGLVTASLAMDDLIASTGVAYRALANPSFMDNLLRQVRSIRDEGVFTDTAAADRKAPTAATRDIAASGRRAAPRPLMDGRRERPGARPGGPLAGRHGAHHVRGARQRRCATSGSRSLTRRGARRRRDRGRVRPGHG